MLKRTKLKTKIFAGFSIVMMLLILVAYAGYGGLSYVVDKVEKADSMNRIIQQLLTIRRHEKNFIIRNNPIYHDKVKKTMELIRNETLETRNKFVQQKNKQMMDNIIAALDGYEKEFEAFVKGKHKDYSEDIKNAAEDIVSDEKEMVMSARELERCLIAAGERQKMK